MMILASAVLAGSLLATGAQARGGGGGGGGHGGGGGGHMGGFGGGHMGGFGGGHIGGFGGAHVGGFGGAHVGGFGAGRMAHVGHEHFGVGRRRFRRRLLRLRPRLPILRVLYLAVYLHLLSARPMLKAPTGGLHSLEGLIRDNWRTAERQRYRVSPTRRDTRAVTRREHGDAPQRSRQHDARSDLSTFLLDEAAAGQPPIGLCQSTTARARSAWRLNSNLVS